LDNSCSFASFVPTAFSIFLTKILSVRMAEVTYLVFCILIILFSFNLVIFLSMTYINNYSLKYRSQDFICILGSSVNFYITWLVHLFCVQILFYLWKLALDSGVISNMLLHIKDDGPEALRVLHSSARGK
jgi:hypothetical protein